MHYLTNDEINAHMEKEEQIKKATEEAKMFAITKTEVIKVVREEVEKTKLNPKTIVNSKEGEKFKKAQDVEHQVLKRDHSQKVKRLMELNKKRVEQYMYERLKKIPGELGIQSALPDPIPEQAPSQSSGRKRKHVELEPEIRVHGLECNQSLPKGVPFVNNMVIKEPEYGIFFTDVFGDQAFQRWNDINKVRVESLVSYLVMASMIKTLENARFCLKLKKLIAEYPDQEKLQSKKVKLELVGYKLPSLVLKDYASDTEHLIFFDNQTSQSPNDDGRATRVEDGSESPFRHNKTDTTTSSLCQEENTATHFGDQSSSEGNLSQIYPGQSLSFNENNLEDG
ncbi:hypothetical protein Tco_0499409 [Tanacetum coccineum]